MIGEPEDDLTPEQIDAMERKLLDQPYKPIAVETRSKRWRTKIDTSDFKPAGEKVVSSLRPRRQPPTFECYRVSPEYGPEYWRIDETRYGKTKLYRNCETERELDATIAQIRRGGYKVTKQGDT